MPKLFPRFVLEDEASLLLLWPSHTEQPQLQLCAHSGAALGLAQGPTELHILDGADQTRVITATKMCKCCHFENSHIKKSCSNELRLTQEFIQD